jgi:hypothetical protein
MPAKAMPTAIASRRPSAPVFALRRRRRAGLANVVPAVAFQDFQVFFRKEALLGKDHKERLRAVAFSLVPEL